MKKNNYIAFALVCAGLSACGGGSSNESTNNGNSTSAANVSVASMGTVPVLTGKATVSQMFLHNDSDEPATNLQFKSPLQLDTRACVSIAAHGSCSVSFTTPMLDAKTPSGSAAISFNYTQAGTTHEVAQVINYAYKQTDQFAGVNFAGSVSAQGKLGATKYVVGYLFAGGATGTLYDNVQLKSALPSVVRINNGFTNGLQLAAGQVQAVEFAVHLDSDQHVTTEVVPHFNGDKAVAVSKTQQKQLNDSALLGTPLSVTLTPVQSAANLVFGNIGLLKVPNAESQTISVVNNGNLDSAPLTVELTGDLANLVQVDNACAGVTLLANAANSCNITFDSTADNSGSVVANFKVDGNTVATQVVDWVNYGDNHPVVSIISSDAESGIVIPMNTNSPSIVTTFTNSGEYDLESMTISPSQSAAAEFVQTATTCGATLAAGSQCTVTGYLYGTYSGTGSFYFRVTGSAKGVEYNFSSRDYYFEVQTLLPFLVNMYALPDTLTLKPTDSNFVDRIYYLQNQSQTSGQIYSLSLNQISGSNINISIPGIDISSTTCYVGLILQAGQSCIVDVKYGPGSLAYTDNEAGLMYLAVLIYGGNPKVLVRYNNMFAYDFKANDASINLESQTVTNLTGAGTQLDPYIGTSANGAMQVKLHYKNPSINYALTNLSFANSSAGVNLLPYGLSVDSSSTCPYGSIKTLEIGGSCDLIINVNPLLLSLLTTGSSTSLNFMTPTASWTTELGTYTQSGSQIYLNYLQPTITSSLSNSSGYYESTTLTMVGTNLSYAAGGTVSLAVNGGQGAAKTVLSSNCQTLSGNSAQQCALGGANAESASISYYLQNMSYGITESMNLAMTPTDANNYAQLIPRSIYATMTAWKPWVTFNAGFTEASTNANSVTTDGTGRVFVATLENCTSTSTGTCTGKVYRRNDDGSFSKLATNFATDARVDGRILLLGAYSEPDDIFIGYLTNVSSTFYLNIKHWNGVSWSGVYTGLSSIGLGNNTGSTGYSQTNWNMDLNNNHQLYVILSGGTSLNSTTAQYLFRCEESTAVCTQKSAGIWAASPNGLTVTSGVRGTQVAVDLSTNNVYLAAVAADNKLYSRIYFENTATFSPPAFVTAATFTTTNGANFAMLVNPVTHVPYIISNPTTSTVSSKAFYCSANCNSTTAMTLSEIVPSTASLAQNLKNSSLMMSYALGNVYIASESTVSSTTQGLVQRIAGSSSWTLYGNEPGSTQGVSAPASSSAMSISNLSAYTDNVTGNFYNVFTDPANGSKSTLRGLVTFSVVQ